jgi:hypothetical protein
MATPTTRISLVSDLRPDGGARRDGRRHGAGPEHLRHGLSLPLGIIAVVAGLALGAMALPQLFAAIAVLQARPLVERYVAGERGLNAADIAHAGERLEFALSLAPDANSALLLADLRLWQARRATDTRVIESLAQQSVDAAKVAVRRAPAHPAAWAALAEALELLTLGGPSVVAPLSRALQVAPYDPRRRDARVELALRHWQALSAEAQRAAGPQIVAMARSDIDRLARLTKRNLGLGAVRGALVVDAELARRFDATYVALPN